MPITSIPNALRICRCGSNVSEPDHRPRFPVSSVPLILFYTTPLFSALHLLGDLAYHRQHQCMACSPSATVVATGAFHYGDSLFSAAAKVDITTPTPQRPTTSDYWLSLELLS
jgi:hypothetical protein